MSCDCSYLKDTELFCECVLVPLDVAYRTKFTSIAFFICLYGEICFVLSSSLIVYFPLVTLLNSQIMNFVICWESCLLHATSSCLIIRTHSSRSLTWIIKIYCVSRTHVFSIAYSINMIIIKENSNGKKHRLFHFTDSNKPCPHTENGNRFYKCGRHHERKIILDIEVLDIANRITYTVLA